MRVVHKIFLLMIETCYASDLFRPKYTNVMFYTCIGASAGGWTGGQPRGKVLASSKIRSFVFLSDACFFPVICLLSRCLMHPNVLF